ncbi:MAG: sulfite exporter TauE/SafE family protein [Ardenticatenaceae bacterium]|nr:sulfite exporter TauE/SafE family protein [Ardenticatenaceae bacterium]MCB9445220.1 sulfite exporter TauE/SafE family protein [Ardenticatenaceae bacterium]
MDLTVLIALILASLVASLFGQGGGVLFTPIQVATGTSFHQATATSLFLIMVISFSATLVFRKAHEINWKMALALEIPTMLGSFLGGIISHWIPENVLLFLLAGLLVLASVFLIRPPAKINRNSRHGKSAWVWHFVWNDETYQLNLVLMLPIMFIVGILTSMTGIGGGVLKVPVMVLLFGIPMHIAVGSSAFMVGLTATAGLLGHVTVGHWDWRSSLLLAIPVLIGGQIGSHLSLRLDAGKLTRWFGVFLLLVAIYTVLHALGLV